jgi:hypothetical protein
VHGLDTHIDEKQRRSADGPLCVRTCVCVLGDGLSQFAWTTPTTQSHDGAFPFPLPTPQLDVVPPPLTLLKACARVMGRRRNRMLLVMPCGSSVGPALWFWYEIRRTVSQIY